MHVAVSRIQQETRPVRPAVTMVRGPAVEPPVRLPRLHAGDMLLWVATRAHKHTHTHTALFSPEESCLMAAPVSQTAPPRWRKGGERLGGGGAGGESALRHRAPGAH